MEITLYFDGASRGNPGPAAVGIVLMDQSGTVLVEKGEYIGVATNNVAEYKAMLRGLEEASNLQASTVSVYGDSELLIKQMNGVYRVKHPNLLPLYQRAQSMIRAFKNISFIYIPRDQNTCADKAANEALDQLDWRA